MPKFELVSAYALAGDQPKATQLLADGVLRGDRAQTLLGVTGSHLARRVPRSMRVHPAPVRTPTTRR
jgi:excinuclease UvrABC helicase subunit UvrB